MSNYDTEENVPGVVEDEPQDPTFSPVDPEAFEGIDEDEEDDVRSNDSEVALRVNPKQRLGKVTDPETGLEFSKGSPTEVPTSQVDRLLELQRRGSALLVRADS